jgi:hypothetical protein
MYDQSNAAATQNIQASQCGWRLACSGDMAAFVMAKSCSVRPHGSASLIEIKRDKMMAWNGGFNKTIG